MHIVRSLTALALLVLLAPAGASAQEKDGKEAGGKSRTYQIPYKMTIPRHIVVRVKINGKGPFNFILDTGAPALIVATPVGRKAGVRPDANHWATIDRIDIEGGLRINNARARIETPFQLEGMNGMGLAGLEIHGLMGYQLLARYRMEIDFTRDKMAWTELDYKPALPLGEGMKGGGQGGLEVFGSLMKSIGSALGRRATPELTLRGFYGMTLVEGDEFPVVQGVLDKGPAGDAGLKAGDLLTKVQGRTVTDVADVLRVSRRLAPGSKVRLTVQRGKDTKEITINTSEGI